MNTVFSKNKSISVMMKKSWDYLIYLKQFLRYFSSITAYILSISWQSGRMYTHLLWWELQNYNSLLKNHQQENVGSYQKKIPHIQGQRSPSKMVGGMKSRSESNPIHTKDAPRIKQNLVHTIRPYRGWSRPAFECLSVSYGGTDQQWPAAEAGALGAADLGMV